MTALNRYAKLECPGLWRAGEGDQRREVVVALGEASLVLWDGRTESALSHWSLPAVLRQNPGEMPAIFAPGPEGGGETLELEEPAMIEAIETVRNALRAAQPHPGRLRAYGFGLTLVAVLALALFWLPGALVSHTASVVPMAKRIEIGRMARDDLIRLTGAPCAEPRGLRAMARLNERLFGAGGGGEVLVMRQGIEGAVHLPGRLLLIDRRLVEDHDSPEVVAGHILAARLRAEQDDPLVPLLRAAGVTATFRLLTSGNLDPQAVAGYAERRLRAPAAVLPSEVLLERFRGAQLSSTPYALSRDPSGETVLDLIEADPFAGNAAPPLLPDSDWISLQAICSP